MHISANSLDDLLHSVLTRLTRRRTKIHGTRGRFVEIPGVLLTLKDPRSRLSRTEVRGRVFSAIGELLWYLSGTDKVNFIQYYIEKYRKESENGIVWGAYGPRLKNARGVNQIENITSLLRHNPHSKRAVIQLFNAEDIADERDSTKRHIDVPCTCSLHFLVRKSKLHLITYMRSNDAILGLPHDFFAFTMLQEIIARSIGTEIGFYKHCVGSLHLYEEGYQAAHKFLEEGWQQTVSMPAMPFGCQNRALKIVLQAESRIRRGKDLQQIDIQTLHPYWGDIIRLLKVYRLIKTDQHEHIPLIKKEMQSSIFNTYIQRRQRITTKPQPEQLSLLSEAD